MTGKKKNSGSESSKKGKARIARKGDPDDDETIVAKNRSSGKSFQDEDVVDIYQGLSKEEKKFLIKKKEEEEENHTESEEENDEEDELEGGEKEGETETESGSESEDMPTEYDDQPDEVSEAASEEEEEEAAPEEEDVDEVEEEVEAVPDADGDGEEAVKPKAKAAEGKNKFYDDLDDKDILYDDDDAIEYNQTEETRVPDEERLLQNKYLTIYECTRIIGTRAKQIATGATPFMTGIEGLSPLRIALLELKNKVIPFKIKKLLPNKKYEVWALKEMELLHDIPLESLP